MERMGFGYEELAEDQSAHHLRVRLRLRPDRAARLQGRAGHSRAGAVGRDAAQMQRRRAADRLCDLALRLHRRHASRAGDPAGAAAAREDRRGQQVAVSLFESMLAMQMQEAAMWLQRELAFLLGRLSADRRASRPRDGAIVLVGAFKTNPLRDICAALGLPDLSADAALRDVHGPGRATRRNCRRCSASASPPSTTEYWLAAARRAGSALRAGADDRRGAGARADHGQRNGRRRCTATATWPADRLAAAHGPRRVPAAPRRRPRSAPTAKTSWPRPGYSAERIAALEARASSHERPFSARRPRRARHARPARRLNAIDPRPKRELMRIWERDRERPRTSASSC